MTKAWGENPKTFELTRRASGNPFSLRDPDGDGVDEGVPSGGTAALAWEAVDGSLGERNTLRVTTDGTYSFGTLPGDYAHLVIDGDYINDNGTESNWLSGVSDGSFVDFNAADSPFGSGTDVVLSRDSANAYQTGVESTLTCENNDATAGTEIGVCLSPKAFVTAGETNSSSWKIAYATWLQTFENDPNEMVRVSYTSISGGPFNTGTNDFDLGEEVQLSNFGSTGYVTYVDTTNQYLYLYYPGVNSTIWDNETVTGLTSGAVAQMPATVSNGSGYWTGSQKACRFLQRSDFGNGGYGAILSDSLQPTGNTGLTSKIYQTSTSYQETYDIARNIDWHRREVAIDLNDQGAGSGIINVTLSGSFGVNTASSNIPLNDTGLDTGRGVALFNWGLECSQVTGDFSAFNNLFAASSFHRVVIGDASTWAACTEKDKQPCVPVSWSDTSIDVLLPRTLTGYIYVIGADNQPVTTDGVLLA